MTLLFFALSSVLSLASPEFVRRYGFSGNTTDDLLVVISHHTSFSPVCCHLWPTCTASGALYLSSFQQHAASETATSPIAVNMPCTWDHRRPAPAVWFTYSRPRKSKLYPSCLQYGKTPFPGLLASVSSGFRSRSPCLMALCLRWEGPLHPRNRR